MIADATVVEALLSAAQSSADRDLRLLYTAWARALLDAERERVRPLNLVLSAIERELARSAAPAQMPLASEGAK